MRLEVFSIDGIGEVVAGDDVGAQVADAAQAQDTPLQPGDVVVIAQKIVSKAEGRLVAVPEGSKDEARAIARRESRRILRDSPAHLIVETRHGWVCANAGVDASNVDAGYVTLLPRDSDASASRIRRTLEERCGAPIAVIVSDTFGRAWREGHTNVAIGSSGIAPILDYRGQFDTAGRELVVTQIAQIDELAGATELVMGKVDRVPAAVVRGYPWQPHEGRAVDLVRPAERDLFR